MLGVGTGRPSIAEETLYIDAEVQRTGDLPQSILIEVPYALAQPGESVVLLAVVARDLETLLGAEEAERIAQLPEGVMVTGGQYIEISVIVSLDNGLT